MYCYFYDKCTQDKKHEQTLARFENQLIERGIHGRVYQLTQFTDGRELVQKALNEGATTIIVVGTDASFVSAVNAVAPFDVTLGYIPLDQQSTIAPLLGLPIGDEACGIIAKRRIAHIDLLQAQDQYLLGSIRISQDHPARIVVDGDYTVRTMATDQWVGIVNAGTILGESPHIEEHAADGYGALIVEPQEEGGLFKKSSSASQLRSRFLFKSIEVVPLKSDAGLLLGDNGMQVTIPSTISIAPDALTVIVGPDRKLISA